jgi:hypothetical protein
MAGDVFSVAHKIKSLSELPETLGVAPGLANCVLVAETGVEFSSPLLLKEKALIESPTAP